MSIHISLDDLLDYTAWQREKWFEQLRKDGGNTLRISAGPNGDGRFQAIGELVRHIFSAEKTLCRAAFGKAVNGFERDRNR
ncbi:MAG: hypothetical protein WA628_21180 [Terriglobales bacterium]